MKNFIFAILFFVCFSSSSFADCCTNRCGVVRKTVKAGCNVVVKTCKIPCVIVNEQPVRTHIQNNRQSNCRNGQCSNPNVGTVTEEVVDNKESISFKIIPENNTLKFKATNH
jgi:hypothetical protein